MPRKARMFLPGVPCHVVSRGNNRQACFYGNDDYGFYLESRCRAYRELFSTALDTSVVHDIQRASTFSMPLGTSRFQEQIEQALSRKLGHAGLGRPKVTRKSG